MSIFNHTTRFEIAHWILTQMFKEQPEMLGNHVLIDADGKLFFERKDVMIEASESKTRIGFLETQTKKYAKKEITDAINLLVSNSHAKLEFTQGGLYNDVFLVSTDKGAIAYINEYYHKEAVERIERWPRKYWWVIDMAKILLPLIIGVAIGVTTGLQNKQQTTKKVVVQYMPKNADTSNTIDSAFLKR